MQNEYRFTSNQMPQKRGQQKCSQNTLQHPLDMPRLCETFPAIAYQDGLLVLQETGGVSQLTYSQATLIGLTLIMQSEVC